MATKNKNSQRAIAFDKENSKRLYIKLYKTSDKDILDYLEKVDNKQGLVKQLLRTHIKKHN